MINDYRKYMLANGVSTAKLDGYEKYSLRNGMISPTIIEERQMNVATMDVFSKLIQERIIFLGTGIDSDVANIVVSQLMYLNSIDDSSDVKLWLNSPGGSVVDGLAIYDVMNWIKPDVATYCMGMCASMGSVLVSSGTKGKRYILPHGEIMIHQPMSGVRPGTQESDFAIAYEQLKKCKGTLYDILSQNTGKSVELLEKDADRDHWFNAKESVEYGLVDQVISKGK